MGIPKFFRFMSERYPLISQLIQDDRIPEFDNLYLDMNGIIHNVSHPQDDSASYRIAEEQIFIGVFAYISHLFSVIKPQKVFFLAIDGVAPRAKMNQQRSRRFRTAKEMKEVVDKAKAKGEIIPEGDGFDSNCITPGTPFMARLSAQLKYFIAKKVSEDSDWRGVEIILSGHEVPGEGEHKIMEYIRLSKAQLGYDANVRHCLYGLDADLIMLGLLSHDPHFCLLREEVIFGPKKGKTKGLEMQNFFLMHLSLFREYLDLEFGSLKTCEPALTFDYDLERIIDDFILLNIFVGNDFLPHLPGLHINEGAIGRLFDIYKRILPVAGGYLNEHGTLNVKRLQLVLNELTVFETEHFEHEFADTSWLKGKVVKVAEKPKSKKGLVLSKEQKRIFTLVKTFVLQNLATISPNDRLVLPSTFAARDRTFLADLAEELHLDVAYDEFDEANFSIIVLSFDAETIELARADDEDDEDDDEADWKGELHRVLNKFDKAEVSKEFSVAEQEKEHAKQLELKMTLWKKEYYKEKLEFDYSDSASLHNLAFRYIEGLQWVLSYYYQGVASWGWFYNYHYAPKISDLQHAGSYEFNFDLGTPFHPFEQLMGVLPDLSSSHIPLAFRDLMSDPLSSIIDFYPVNFDQDLNGKKQDWEAIVKIPFIDEKRLLGAMKQRAHRLTPEEVKRNQFGDSTRFVYDEKVDPHYPSSLPGFFPDLLDCRCLLEAFDLPTLTGGLSYLPGLVPGALTGKDAISGFPSLFTLPFRGALDFHGVNVFQTDSRKETMVVTIDNLYKDVTSEEVALGLVGRRTYVGYPFLQEAEITAVSDNLFRYEIEMFQGKRRVRPLPHRPESLMGWKRSADKIEHSYSKRYGVIIGKVGIIVHARLIKGLLRLEDGSHVKEFEERETDFAVQATVKDVGSEDIRYLETPAVPVEVEFPEGCDIFSLGSHAYGVPARVLGHENGAIAVAIAYYPNDSAENTRFRSVTQAAGRTAYYPSHSLTRQLRMSGLALSKLTSSMMVSLGESKTNIGLNLKFEAKSQKVLGYSRKGDAGWEFSMKAIELIKEYNARFPEVSEALENKNRDLTSAKDIFREGTAEKRLKELKAFLVEKGVRDFDKVPLYSEQLDKDAVMAIEVLSDALTQAKTTAGIKRAALKGLPRGALLKPSHAVGRLQGQHFALGDRVVTVTDAGTVPTSSKGTVVGIQVGFLDVLFDVQFIGGTTLGDRCSLYRGSTVAPTTVLNLTDQQYVFANADEISGAGPHSAQQKQRNQAPPPNPNAKFARGAPGGPSIIPANGRLPAGGFHPAPATAARSFPNGVRVLQNPARPFDGNYGGVARGDLPPHIASSSSHHTQRQPQQPATHQQNLGAALGINPNSGRGDGAAGTRGRGGLANRGGSVGGGFQSQQPQQTFTPAMRGGHSSIRGAISVGNGFAIPPPAHLIHDSNGHGSRGGHAFRGGRGGERNGNHA